MVGYAMLPGHFLMETFKVDVGISVVPVGRLPLSVMACSLQLEACSFSRTPPLSGA